MISLWRVASVIVPIAVTLVGIAGTGYTSLAGRVDALQVQSASQQQATTDIDARLTRIENKLDAALAPAKVLH